LKIKINYLIWNAAYTAAKKIEQFVVRIEGERYTSEKKFSDKKILILSTLIPDDVEKTIL